MQAETRSDRNDKSASESVSSNECHQVSRDNRTTQNFSMKISNLSEGSKECFTEAEKQSSATEDISKPSAICNKNDCKNLKQKLQEVELRAQEATLKLQQANVIVNRIEKSRRILKKHVRRLIDEKKKIAQDNLKSQARLKLILKQIFNDDQIQILLGQNSRGIKWSNNTIFKALQLKFSCGSNGYNELIKHLPLPSERTLRRKKESINFEEGILEDVFDILKKQVSLFKDDREKDAAIAIDEMSLVPGKQFDPSTLSHIGNTSISDSSGIFF